ncbi:MAG: hypothetical protein ACRD3L_14210 [Terriglobales bacterium]
MPRNRVSSLALLCVVFVGANAAGAELRPETVAAFDQYVQRSEEERASLPFLRLEKLPAQDRNAAMVRLKDGEIAKALADNGKPIAVPGGLIHDWLGMVFIPGATLAQTLAFLEDYDNQYKFYAPEVQQSKLIDRQGDHFRIFLRLRKTKVITVVLNSEYDVRYSRLDEDHAISESRSTRIAEVENAGKPSEKEKPVGNDSGFLWRLNSYWRFQQADGGVYVELEAISLTRDIPVGLGWLVTPFVTSIPKESVIYTLSKTRQGILGQRER